jgi:hypothetical protein
MFTTWALNQPNDANADQDCMTIVIDGAVGFAPGAWNDDVCTATHDAVCDFPPGGTPPDECNDVLASLGDGGVRVLCEPELTFPAARAACIEAGGDLAIVRSQAEHVVLVDALLADAFVSEEVWIGGRDVAVEGTWRWLDGTLIPTPFSAWADGEPNGGVLENCIELRQYAPQTLEWNDFVCAQPHPYVCDAPMAPEPAGCTAMPGGALGQRLFCDDDLSHTDATMACESYGGALVRIDSATDHAEITSAALPLLGPQVWIGGSDEDVEGEWRWPDGTRFELLASGSGN